MPTRKNPADKVQARGETRMRERGCKKVAVWFDPAEYALVVAAAGPKPLATWVREQAYLAAASADQERRRARERERRSATPPGSAGAAS